MIDIVQHQSRSGFAWITTCGHMCGNHVMFDCCHCGGDIVPWCGICVLLKEGNG